MATMPFSVLHNSDKSSSTGAIASSGIWGKKNSSERSKNRTKLSQHGAYFHYVNISLKIPMIIKEG
jgi:hypothetical protein